MPIRQRLGLIAMMTVSLLTMTASIMKLVAVQGSSHISPDVQYNASLEMLWVGLEQTFVIIMGCVPSLRSVFKLESVKSISSSLSSLLRRTNEKSKLSTMNSGSGVYTDLELNANKLGDLNGTGTAPITVISHPQRGQDSQERLAPIDTVWREDRFTLSYHNNDKQLVT